MIGGRNYSNLTRRTTTTADPGTSGNTLTVADSTVLSSLDGHFPYTALISWGQSDQEVVLVTARPTSTTLTITRGQDGTTAVAHPIGATVDHGVSAQDYRDIYTHLANSWVNVRDYGATGDGVTNDAAAIQSALDQASVTNPGATVYFPPGQYRPQSELEIKGPCTIYVAAGATIKRGSAAMQYLFKNFNSSYAPLGYAGRGNITITGRGVLDGGATDFTTPCTVVIFAHADTILVEGVTIQNVVDWHAIEYNSTRNGRISKVTAQGFRLVTTGREISEAFQVDLAVDSSALPGIGTASYDNTPCLDVEIEGCTVRGIPGGYGSFGCITGSHSWTDTHQHSGVRVIGNYADGLSHYMVAGLNWTNTVISANECVNSNAFVSITLPSSGATQDLFRAVITGNIVYNSGVANQAPSALTECVLIDGNDASGAGNVIRDVLIQGNSFHTIANTGACVSALNTADLVVTGNSFKTVTGHAVYPQMCRSANISVNKFSSITGRCVYLVDGTNGSSTRSKVGGNTIDGFSDYGIEALSTGVEIHDNHMNDPGTSGKACIRIAGTDAVVSTNTLWRGGGSASSNGIEIASTSTSSYLTGNRMKGWATATSTAASGVTGTAVWAVGNVTLDPAIASFTTGSINKINTAN